ncbi:MAG: M48 family metalloprotease [Deltaproteobacteria bacterium]|nr:M48 family metalloprotease [Deltaproteobacteria bacterium]
MTALAHSSGHRAANYAKTAMLMAALTALALVVGAKLGGSSGLILAALFIGGTNLVSYWFSDRIALALNRAQPVPPGELPEVERIVTELATRAQIPVPKLYVIPTGSPNAFATGRNPEHAAVAVTAGILDLLDARELRGVLAHELSHVVNRDTLISTVAGTMAGLISFLARSIFWLGGAMLGGGGDRRRGGGLAELGVILVAPLVALLLQLAVSRSREFGADASGAELCDDPQALASALAKLENGVRRIPDATAPATSHLFIVNPLSGTSLRSLFSTHPPTQERIRRLLGQGA